MKSGEIWKYNQGLLVVKLKNKVIAGNFRVNEPLECWKVEVLETDGSLCDFGSGLNIIPFISLTEFFTKDYEKETQ